MKKRFEPHCYIGMNGLSVHDLMLGPILNTLWKHSRFELYDKDDDKLIDSMSTKFRRYRVFAFSVEVINGERVVTIEFTKKLLPLTDRRLFRVKPTALTIFGESTNVDVTYRGSIVAINMKKEYVEVFIDSFITGVRHTLTGNILDKYPLR